MIPLSLIVVTLIRTSTIDLFMPFFYLPLSFPFPFQFYVRLSLPLLQPLQLPFFLSLRYSGSSSLYDPRLILFHVSVCGSFTNDIHHTVMRQLFRPT